MSKVITYSYQKPQGTFAQIKLDDSKRVLISITQTEIVIFKLILGGSIPKGKVWQRDIISFIYKTESKEEYNDKNPLDVAVDIILSCKSIEEIAPKLDELMK